MPSCCRRRHHATPVSEFTSLALIAAGIPGTLVLRRRKK
ncbi:PEP-CTERM sorting domain-containing protein [Candidatus Alkanophaga liquidiphilum]